MLGNFFELGPWRVSLGQNTLVPNPAPWNRLFGLIFLDNPIGVGFSIASTPEEIPRDQFAVSKHLFEAILYFLAQNPSFRTRPIYITGESYAGKYVPTFGYYVLKKNLRLPVSKRINLAGVAIGNGLTDPITQVTTHAMNAYYFGLINEKQKAQMEKLQDVAVDLTKRGNWSEAADARNRVWEMLENVTDLATLYDFRRLVPYKTSLVTKFLNQNEVKSALGVDESIAYEECSDVVKKVLHGDVMKSVRYKVEYLVKNTKVLLYQGQCDLRDGVVSTEAWVRKMRWEGIREFLERDREVWKVDGKLAGYVQKWRNLSHVVVLGAGHLVPADQALNSQDMIENWVLGKGLYGSGEFEDRYSDSPV